MSRENCLLFVLIGSLLIVKDCQSRAVNISNTWTLPQEGFSVFYRFFRDKISWFEADAVCQFHHANLVTVDDGVQFDATRAFLKELDVTEFVWIGLIRPQNSLHFGWTNSKPLDLTSGYWADPLPAMESPLCVVIDPTRDFRWHALRCGGPETAAFLCEMEVPQWAVEFTIQAMPSLTVQYMSDSGTVELSRDCGEEGTRHMLCHGKEDRNIILSELTCIDDAEKSANSIKTSSTLLVDIHQKSLELIKSVMSDNKEDNNIDSVVDSMAKSEQKTVNGFKLNMDIMLGDQPMPVADEKDDRKLILKNDEKYLKKINNKEIRQSESGEKLIIGDQPFEEQHGGLVQNSVIKSKPQNVLTKAPLSSTAAKVIETVVSSTTITITTETRLRRETDVSINEAHSTHSPIFVADSMSETTTNLSPVYQLIKKYENATKNHVTDEHPATIHYQKEIQEINLVSDHFIPPMLLVRTQFSQLNGHNNHVESSGKHIVGTDTTIPNQKNGATDEIPTAFNNLVTTEVASRTVIPTTQPATIDVTTKRITISEPSSYVEVSTKNPETSTELWFPISNKMDETTKSLGTTTLKANEQTDDFKKLTETNHTLMAESSRFRQPHAPNHSAELHPKIPIKTSSSIILTKYVSTQDSLYTSLTNQTIANIVIAKKRDSEALTTTPPAVEINPEQSVRNNCTSHLNSSNEKSLDFRKSHSTAVHHQHHHGSHSDHTLSDNLSDSGDSGEPCWTEDNLSVDLSNLDDFQPHRPNRRRVLTKPETHSYIKKVLG